MDTSDAGDNQADRSTFRGFGNESNLLAQNLMDTRRAANRPHPIDRGIIDFGEASPVKRRRLTEPLPDGNENQRRSSTEYDFHYFANAETDTDSDAEANDTVTIKRELGIEQIGFDEADVEPEKPKMYFEWLDKKTLVKIFDQLNLYDLLQMADEDTRIAQIIGEEIMALRVLNIPEISPHYSVRHAFKHFGQFVSEVVINQSDIQWKDNELSEVEEIFRLIAKRCSDGKLKKLSIGFDMKDKNAYELRTEIPECVKALQSLTITQVKFRNKRDEININYCLELLLIKCTDLKSLTLNGIKSSGQFLTALNGIKLQELRFDDCRFSEFTCWLKFVQNRIPSLKSFGWNKLVVDGINLFEVIFVHISMAFQQLERLSFDAESNSMVKFIKFVKLPQNPLKALHLRCLLHDNYVRVALSQICYLQELHIEIVGWHSWRCWHFWHSSNENPISWEKAMEGLTELQDVNIQLKCCFEWNTIIKWMAKLSKVRRVEFKGKTAMGWKTIKNIVSCLPTVDTLKLNLPIKSFTPKFYNALVSDRSAWHRNSPELEIYMDAGKVSRLKKTVVDYDNKAKCIRLCELMET